MTEKISVVCFLWDEGTKEFLPKHVNMLAKMVKKHLPIPHRFICITDEIEGFDEDVEVFKLPENVEWIKKIKNTFNSYFPSSYRRLWIFSEEAKCLGERILMLDIDCLIVSSLIPLFKIPDDFVGWRPRSTKTSPVKSTTGVKRICGGTMLLRTGTHTFIWDTFSLEGIEKAKKQRWGGSDQAWLSYNLAKDCAVFPDAIGIYHSQDGARIWKNLPEDACIIHFNGLINPWEEEAKSRPWLCKLLNVPFDSKKWNNKTREQVLVNRRRKLLELKRKKMER